MLYCGPTPGLISCAMEWSRDDALHLTVRHIVAVQSFQSAVSLYWPNLFIHMSYITSMKVHCGACYHIRIGRKDSCLSLCILRFLPYSVCLIILVFFYTANITSKYIQHYSINEYNCIVQINNIIDLDYTNHTLKAKNYVWERVHTKLTLVSSNHYYKTSATHLLMH